MAIESPLHRGSASSARTLSTALIFTTIFDSKSAPEFSPRYSWVGRAKQLWLTTPLAMKSPVPVVMSYSCTCDVNASTALIPRLGEVVTDDPTRSSAEGANRPGPINWSPAESDGPAAG